MQLRHYQEKFVNGLAVKLAQGIRKLIGQLPTGGGKTVCFATIANRYISKSSKSVLILVHRKELLDQTRRTLYNLYGINAHPIVAGVKYIPAAKVYVGMVESVGRRINRIKNIGLVIIDEAHIAAFNKLHQYFPEQFIIGVTATPQSASKKNPLKNHYNDIVCSIDIPDLIKEGFLAQNITIAPKEVVDRAELAKKGNDFDDAIMGAKFSQPKYIQSTIYAYQKHALGKKTIIFNATVEHSLKVTEAFRKAGYNCRHIDGDTPKAERDAAFRWLKITPDAILCNVGIATTGFDEPTIEAVIVNKGTMSMPLWLQMSGRGGRIVDEKFIAEKQREYPYPLSLKKMFTIIDMGGNAVTHGDWCDPRDWEYIFKNPKKPSQKEAAAPSKSCDRCDAIIPASARICKWCGFEFPINEINDEEQVMKEFIVVTKGINVKEIINAHKDRKEYFTFFHIAIRVAEEAKNNIKSLTEKELPVILNRCNELAKQWCHEKGKKFNQWHRQTIEVKLYEELKKRYPKWEPPIQLPEPYNPQPKSQSTASFIKPVVGPSLSTSLYDITL